jgi:hypothetical protein
VPVSFPALASWWMMPESVVPPSLPPVAFVLLLLHAAKTATMENPRTEEPMSRERFMLLLAA